MYTKGKYAFAFNFNPDQSFQNYFFPVSEQGTYSVVLTTDDASFGGFNRVDMEYEYKTEKIADGRTGFFCYLPARTAIVYKKK